MKLPVDLFDKTESELRGYRYQCKCLTCEQVFFNRNLSNLKKLFETGEWDSTRPMRWYVKAGFHWLESDLEHEIVVVIRYPDKTEEILQHLSAEWKNRLQFEPDQSNAAMLNELRRLEASFPPEEKRPAK